MRSGKLFTIVAAALAMGSVPASSAGQSYNVIDVGSLGYRAPAITNPTAVNSSGQVVGQTLLDPFPPGTPLLPFLWTYGTLTNLGRVGNRDRSTSWAINDSGQIAGDQSYDDTPHRPLPFLWTAQTGLQLLPTLGGDGRALGINAGGTMAGWSSLQVDSSILHAVKWQDGGVIDMGQGAACCINDAGQMAGTLVIGGATHGVVWDSSGGIQDLGGAFTPRAINQGGQVAGTLAIDDTTFHAALWDPGTGIQDLGTLGGRTSLPYAISDHLIVGSSLISPDDPFTQHAFVYDLQNPAMVDLDDLIPPDSGWQLLWASGVNAAGQIVGRGQHAVDSRVVGSGGFLLTPWSNRDVGDVGVQGNTAYAAGQFTVNGAGADIWGADDAFQFAYQAVGGDAEIIARVTSIQDTDPFAKAGVMLRETLAASSADVILDVRPTGDIEFMTRPAPGADRVFVAGASTEQSPVWLRLVRTGDTVTGSMSADGVTWTTVGSTAVTMSSGGFIGLAVTSHDPTVLNASTFDHVAVTPAWANRDLPDSDSTWGVGGGTQYVAGQLVVSGSGADIAGTHDEFQFVHRAVTGDAEIVARIASIQSATDLAKAGVMIRSALNDSGNEAHVTLDVRPTGDIELITRPSPNAGTMSVGGAAQQQPTWLKLIRSGDLVTGAVSPDGVTWTVIGSTTFPGPGSMEFGLAVTSHDRTLLSTATFDRISITPR
jgi:probable HAF family extracellular repeat protein